MTKNVFICLCPPKNKSVSVLKVKSFPYFCDANLFASVKVAQGIILHPVSFSFSRISCRKVCVVAEFGLVFWTLRKYAYMSCAFLCLNLSQSIRIIGSEKNWMRTLLLVSLKILKNSGQISSMHGCIISRQIGMRFLRHIMRCELIISRTAI